jgi:uroporphyrin-3 C-methyltransferase
MSASDTDTTSTPAPTPSPAAPSSAPAPKPPRPPRPPRRGSALAGLALVLALIALIAVAFGGWRLWQVERGGHNDSQALHAMQNRVQALDAQLGTLSKQDQTLQQQLQATTQQGQSLGAQLDGLSARNRSLENAVAGLTAQAHSGHDAMRLDEAEMLLRMAAQRFRLFHDSNTAMQAYAMADRVLAEVEDPAYAGVRQSIRQERKALAATQPQQRQSDLDTLARLRNEVAGLPLKPLNTPEKTAPKGFWQRAWHAVSGIVRISRDNGEVTPAKRSLSHSLVALDLAQAQAALLAWDSTASQRALRHADTLLQRFFDPDDADVKSTRAQIAQLLAQPAHAAPQLGQALHELQNLRAVHDAAPASASSTAGQGARR